MTIIAEKFKEILLEKTEEKNYRVDSKHLRNIIALREKFNCNVYYLTSNISAKPFKGFWNFSDKQISELKGGKSRFVVVFLIASDTGYVMYDNGIEQYLKDLPIVEGYFKIREDYLRSRNVPTFRTIDEFIDLLSSYQNKWIKPN